MLLTGTRLVADPSISKSPGQLFCYSQFLIFYKTPGTPDEEHEAARKRIRESGKDAGV